MRTLPLASLTIFSIIFISGESSPLWAQAVAVAQLEGVISDPSGAAVPDAEVQATQTDTSLTLKTVSGPSGNYILPNLLVGPYSLEVTAKGFTKYIQTGIVL